MKKINFIMALHNHQPVGNFDFVFEEACQNAYLPFMNVFGEFDRLKIVQHYTGILLEWIEQNHPELIHQLRKFVAEQRLEMMTGGYYEPILTIIPDEDKIDQIKKLTRYVQEQTGYDPIGIWLAERVWEPQLPQPIREAGAVYTVIDDAHFKFAGLEEKDLYGYYVTEHNGATLNLFPISEKLRYTMPFRPPEETIDYLQSLATEDGQRLIVFADDGEKFGVWPHTFEQCYEKEWLRNFFKLLTQNLDWINLITFNEALHFLKPVGRVYLPTASYREMMEWALPTNAIHNYEKLDSFLKERQIPTEQRIFVKGGFWRNFFIKYAEANNLHKRMIWQARRYRKLADQRKSFELDNARDHLFAAQCNCPYWHGVFGGLYLPHLRNAIYTHLIQSDVQMDVQEKSATQQQQGWVTSEIFDFDADGQDEVIVNTDRMNLFFSPHSGGSLFELDYKPKALNLLDVMSRREEGYHHKLFQATHTTEQTNAGDSVASIHDVVLTKEQGLERYLNYDWYRRASLLDHFLREDTTVEDLAQARYGEQGDFVNQPFDFQVKKSGKYLHVIFKRDGHVWVGPRFMSVRLQKTVVIEPKSDRLAINYEIQNLDSESAWFWFGTEFSFALLAGDAPDRYYVSPSGDLLDPKLASTGQIENVREIILRDEWQKLDIQILTDREGSIWRFPIETISMSEAGFERVYQASVVFPNWRFLLKPKEKWQVTIEQNTRLLG